MLPRRTEPELMSGEEQVQAYAAADFSKPHSDIIRQFQSNFRSLPPQAKIVDLGCGPGDITIRIAGLYPTCSIDAVDGSQAMLDQAARILAKADLSTRVRLIQAVLPELTGLSDAGYDVIISNSLLHHLHDPRTLWKTIKTLAKTNAYIFVADLRRPDSEKEARLLVKKHAASEVEILQHDFYRSLLAAFTLQELRAQIKEAELGLQIKSLGDRHVIISGKINPVHVRTDAT